MKKYFFVVTLIIIIVFSYIKVIPLVRDKFSVYKDEVSYVSMVDNKYFYFYQFGEWKKEFIKGVNIGAGKPGSFPGELSITKEEYLRWLKYIGKMNANTIRVYTILKPAFYEALYEYNRNNAEPIYVMHGVWVNEEDISSLEDAYNSKITERFKQDIKSIIDIIHGNAVISEEKGHASGIYTKDVSQYVSAWILGIEWDPDFVLETNKKNADKTNFNGQYLFTKEASPFEAWLAMIGDYAISYETEKYKMQRPLSFTNWVTTDMLSHPNEPLKDEDKAVVNTEHIKRNESFKPGLFASYHIYPYYPDFMNYDKKYINFKDEDGRINTYRAYLKDLIKEHSVPVLVAEFGVPASRGKAHENIHMGFNQGNIDEKSQGEMNVFMLNNIFQEGYAGGLVFTWQDEWFKRTWNTMDFDIADRRPYWSNPQTNEQEFGILAFDPGENESICYVDGDIEDWKKDTPLVVAENSSLYVKCDEKYVYFMINLKGYDFNKDKIIIPIDLLNNQGNMEAKDLKLNFNRAVDFLITLDGKDNSRILVDSYYDSFYYTYSRLKMLPVNSDYEKKNSGFFNSMYLCLNRELYLPEDKITLPLSKYETGKLVFGDGNPSHKEYNSLTDYSVKGENIEIRIPWQLLNIMDPSTKMAMDDLYKDGIMPIKIDGIYSGVIVQRDGKNIIESTMNFYSWKEWEQPKYHERLKPSYYILKEAFKKLR
ncbi:family 2 glycosyl transferase [Clostridium sp. SYSU_GA19001]|uniref:family 2 glycosyl transferase n=1 Tax=Clostridium caldaquaticum TaxID=2940653 RepID=UPI0020771101|nr:family 2 glycosyl transferase [Clostridium caldaquaticum]MCM8709818.1 family 2 glycosyl transferase [Clostridium caldaquaticum]